MNYIQIITYQNLKKEYITNNKSAYQIARELNCAPSTIYRYLKKFNIQQNRNKVDITDKKSYMLTAIRVVGKRKNYSTIWLCRCDCGNEVEVDVSHFNAGDVKSCGCIMKQRKTNKNG